MFEWFKKKPTSEWPEYSIEEIKKRARILVIDDHEFPYQRLFQRDGYQVDKWTEIENLPKLEQAFYDVILLDIHGVGVEDSEEQGFGILKHLKKVSPAQIIIAYSNADWALKYQDFFDMADARLDKRQDYVEFKRIVDEQLNRRFSLGFYLDRITRESGAKSSDIAKLRSVSESAIRSRDIKKLESYLDTNIDNKDKIQIALSIAQVAIGIASI